MRRLLAVLSLCVLASCGTMKSHPVAWQIGVTYAIQKYVHEKPEDKQEATKERIRAVAGQLKAIAGGDSVTLPLLRLALDVELDKAGLAPPDRVLLAAVADAVVLELTRRVGDGVIPPDQVFEVIAVLEIVERAAA